MKTKISVIQNDNRDMEVEVHGRRPDLFTCLLVLSKRLLELDAIDAQTYHFIIDIADSTKQCINKKEAASLQEQESGKEKKSTCTHCSTRPDNLQDKARDDVPPEVTQLLRDIFRGDRVE